MNRTLCLFLTSLSVLSCFVKEDRSVCPGRLILDFSEIDTNLVKCVDILGYDGNGVLFTDRVWADRFNEDYLIHVPHGDVSVNAMSGTDERTGASPKLTIPFGCECPLLYMQSFVVDTRGEVVRKVVELHKNHCLLTVEMQGVEDAPYSFTLKGNVDGYGFDGLPSTGDFSCVAYPDPEGRSRASVPRQLDNSLLLEVDDGTGIRKVFAIGEYMVKSGYDWSAEDLEDVTVMIDYYSTSIKLIVQGWDKEYVYNVIL